MRIAIIGGTGFGEGFGEGSPEVIETKYGPAQITRHVMEQGSEIVFIARHGPGHRLPPHLINHRANIAAISEIGATAVFATAAVGSLQSHITPGDFVVLDDFIDLTKGEVVTFFDQPDNVRHTDFSHPFDSKLRETLLATAIHSDNYCIHHQGTYICLSGPRYETPAEVRLFAAWGGDVVGMTAAPEAILCREMGLPYASIATVTNVACGLPSAGILSHEDVTRRMLSSTETLRAWLMAAARA